MATQYLATDALGTTHTRKTDRTYTHTVVTQYGYEAAVAHCHAAHAAETARELKSPTANFKYYTDIAAGNDKYPEADWIGGARVVNEARQALRIADAQARIEGGFDAYRARILADALARIEANKAAGYYTRFHNLGWCGRLDLAQKLAAKTGGTILPARVK